MPSEAISRSRVVPGSRPARLGVVGAGLVAQVAHLPLLRDRDELFTPAALVEPDEAVRRRVASRFGFARATSTLDELLLDADGDPRDALDAVLIASPNGAHAEQVLAALDGGLHVLVEKPMCLSPADARRIVAARDRSGLVVQVGYMKRYDPAVEALAERLAGAEILHVESVTYDPGLRERFAPDRHAAGERAAGMAAAGPPRGPSAPAAAPGTLAARTLAQAREAVGAPDQRRAAWWSDVFLGALVHDVNLVRGLLDRAATPVVGVADAFAGDDRAGGTLVLANGARWTAAWLAMPGVADFGERVTLFTDRGIDRLEFPAPYLLHAPTIYTHARGRDGAHEERTTTSWEESYERSLVHFRACLAGGEACRTPPEQAAADTDLLAALFRGAVAPAPPAALATALPEAAA